MPSQVFTVHISYNKSSGYLGGAPSLEVALTHANKMGNFYEVLYPGTVHMCITVACETCQGVGRLAKGRKNVRFPKYIDCAACHGVGHLPIPTVLPVLTGKVD